MATLRLPLPNGHRPTPTSNGAKPGWRPGAPDSVPACSPSPAQAHPTDDQRQLRAAATVNCRLHHAADRGPRGERSRRSCAQRSTLRFTGPSPNDGTAARASREFQPEQLALEPAIFCPRQVLHDPANGEIGGLEHTRRGVHLVQVSQLARDDVPELVEELFEDASFARWPKLRVPRTGIGHSGSLPPPAATTRRRPRRGWHRACGGFRRAPREPGRAARPSRRSRPGRPRS